jgi:4'-phosphopantetheinyl transferase
MACCDLHDYIWRPPPAEPALARDEVHVWRAPLSLSAARIHELRQTLSTDELERAESFRFLKDRQRFIAARGILRAILSRYLKVEPGLLRFCYNAYGKPALDSGTGRSNEISFNMAHSGQLAVYALTLTRQLGIDIEHIRAVPDYERIAEQFFSPQEQSALRAIPAHLKSEAFFNCWTRKEAYVKARGEGLSLPLDQFAVSLTPGEPARLLSIAGAPHELAHWSLRELQPGPGYVGAVAIGATDWQLQCWQWLEYDSNFG